MAKGKRAAALFEVIHRDVRYAPVRRRQSPMNWLKDRLSHAPGLSGLGHAAAASEGGVATADADPTLRPHPMLNHPVAPSPAPQGLGMTHIEPGDRLMAAAASSMSGASTLHSTPSAPPVLVDRDRQLIRFRLTYTSAAIGGFAVVVALLLAYIVGRGGPATPDAPQNGQTSEQIRAGAVAPGVMDINPNGDNGGLATHMTIAANATEKPAGRPVPPPPTPTTRGDRIVGMNYVIVQSYPEEQDAQAAVEVLRQYGVSASVVKGTAYAPRWYSVVGLEPFDHIKSNGEYQQYVKRITQISDKFAGNSKFKQFEPRPYKWQNH